tara:strand:+ start:503 stop:1180 length:678 start_codon:yes stop_codon:yes gene_type:complete
VLFSYNFPHKKTCDFIENIIKAKYNISLIIAAEFIHIDSSKREIENLSRYHPVDLATKYNIPFKVAAHNSRECIELLKSNNINLGVITGSRILNSNIINNIKYGILNFHPAILPLIRGLDSIFWSISKNVPIGVTAHLINHKIDLGDLVCQDVINIEYSDTIELIIEKNYQLQLKLVPIALNLLSSLDTFQEIEGGVYNTKMSKQEKLNTIRGVCKYIKNHVKKN